MSEPWEARPYQVRTVKWILENPGAGIFQEPGMGKTSSVLYAFTVLQEQSVVDRMLVVCPLSVIGVWQDEVSKWEFSEHLNVVVLHGTRKDRLLHPANEADIVVINYDGLHWLSRQVAAGRFELPGMLVCDESTALANPRTARFRTLKGLLPQFDRRVMLTGTPSANGFMKLFGQVYAIDLGERFSPFITRFRNTYFTQIPPFQKYVPHPDAGERIAEVIGDVCMYLERAEYLELPPRVETRVRVDIDDKVRKQYERLEREFMLELEDGIVTAANAGVKAGKLRQFLGGAIFVDSEDDDGRWSGVHDAKVEATINRIDEGGEPTIVVYEYTHEYERLVQAFDREEWTWGAVRGTPRKRREVVRAWNDGELDVLLIHPQSAGHGLNLQFGGRRILWFQPTWNLEHWIQTNNRADRPGQEDTVFIDVLCVPKTYDDVIFDVMLEGKKQSQADLLAALKARG